MDRDQYHQIKKTSDLVKKALQNDNLSVDERQRLEISQAQMSGYLCSTWLPVGIGRKSVMVALLIIGIYGVVIDKPIIAVCWLLVPLFSPRLVGEFLLMIGTIKSTR